MDMWLLGDYPSLFCNLVWPWDQTLFNRLGVEMECASISVTCLPLSLSPSLLTWMLIHCRELQLPFKLKTALCSGEQSNKTEGTWVPGPGELPGQPCAAYTQTVAWKTPTPTAVRSPLLHAQYRSETCKKCLKAFWEWVIKLQNLRLGRRWGNGRGKGRGKESAGPGEQAGTRLWSALNTVTKNLGFICRTPRIMEAVKCENICCFIRIEGGGEIPSLFGLKN